MKTPSRIPLIACGAAAMTLLAVHAPASQAQPGKGTPTETGCYDITAGTIDFTRSIERTDVTVTPTIEHPADTGSLTAHVHEAPSVRSYTSAFTDDADVIVTARTANAAGVDCAAVTYRLRIFDEDHVLLADLAVPGGDAGEITWKTGFSYPRNADGSPRAAYFSATTETASGRVVDTAPDDPTGLLAVIDEGGATSSFN